MQPATAYALPLGSTVRAATEGDWKYAVRCAGRTRWGVPQGGYE